MSESIISKVARNFGSGETRGGWTLKQMGNRQRRIAIGKEYFELLAATKSKRGSGRAKYLKGRLMRKYGVSDSTIEHARLEYEKHERTMSILKSAYADIDNNDLSSGVE